MLIEFLNEIYLILDEVTRLQTKLELCIKSFEFFNSDNINEYKNEQDNKKDYKSLR